MAKFCNQCGRLLNEGEICNCQQKNSDEHSTSNQQNASESAFKSSYTTTQAQFNRTVGQFADDTKNMFAKILPIIKNPVGETKNIVSSGSSILGMEMLFFNIAVTFVLLVVAMVAIRLKLGSYASWIQLPYVKIVISVTFLTAASYFAMAGLLLLASKVFFKAETFFAEIISITGTKALIDAFFLVISTLLALIFPKAGVLVFVVGSIFTTLIFLFSYAESVELDASKKVYSLLITYVGLALFYYLAYQAFFEDSISHLVSIF